MSNKNSEVENAAASENASSKRGRKRKAKEPKKEELEPEKEETKEPKEKKGKQETAAAEPNVKTAKSEDEWNLKIISWNVDGLRAWCKKNGHKFLEEENPDIFCLQETKCPENQLPDEIRNLKEYKQYWQASNDKSGYAGVALFSKKEPISVSYGIEEDEHDSEGRCITAEYDKFFVICVYVPNAGRKLVTLPKRLDWNKAFKSYIKKLDQKKPVIICGDMNVAHNEIDLANPKTNTKNAGFTKEEREGMTDFLSEGFVDTYRKFYPDTTGAYTFWTYMRNARSNNIGWRLDYFIVSERFMENVCDNVIKSDVLGSDHCPITLLLNV